MPTLEAVIARKRRDIARRESPIFRAMRTAYGQAITRLDTDLLAVTARIEQAIAGGEPVSEAWLQREGRYRRLLAQADAEFVRFGGDARDILTQGTRAAALAGASDAAKLLDAVGVRVASANLPTAATERLIASFSPESPLSRVIARYGSEAVATIERRLVETVTGGLGPRSVARQISVDLDSPLQRARLLALTRTELMRSYRGGLSDQYQGVAHLLQGVRWLATKSTRTCLACLAMDGRIYPVEDTPYHFHVCCRCTFIPVLRDQHVASPETGAAWFDRQSQTAQREMLGDEGFAAYHRGELTLGQLIGYRHSPQWGTSVQQKSVRETIGAGLDRDERIRRATADLRTLPRAGVLYAARIPSAALRHWPQSTSPHLVVLSSRRAHYLTAHPELRDFEEDVVRTMMDPDLITKEQGGRGGAVFYRTMDDGFVVRIPVYITERTGFENSLNTVYRTTQREADRMRRRREQVVWRRDE